MSVYTPVDKIDLESMLKKYTIGNLTDFSGVEDGIENTTYFIDTEKGSSVFEWVLTIFEHINTDMLEQYAQLMAYLSQAGIPIPNPVCDATGKAVQELKDKPAILSPKFSGSHITRPESIHCEQIGTMLAKLHTKTESYPHAIPNACDFSWITKETDLWIKKLATQERQLMESALNICRKTLPQYAHMPKSVIHGDLFVDNALFKDDALTGVIDFYSAGIDFMLMDVAVAINDWCVDATGAIDNALMASLLNSYQTVRTLTHDEQQALPFFLYLAALRYWTLRLKIQIQNSEQAHSGDLIKFKDPIWFCEILKMRHNENF